MNLHDLFSWLQGLGYFGAFLISLIGNLSVMVNVPYYFFIFSMGAVLDPTLVGLLAGAGAAIGEFLSYTIGYLGKGFVKGHAERSSLFSRAKKWFEKNGFFTIVFFAVTPLPDDVVGLLSGATEYSKKRYLLAVFIGKSLMSLLLAWGGKFSIEAILHYFSFSPVGG